MFILINPEWPKQKANLVGFVLHKGVSARKFFNKDSLKKFTKNLKAFYLRLKMSKCFLTFDCKTFLLLLHLAIEASPLNTINSYSYFCKPLFESIYSCRLELT